jgi:hypothetical protein
MTEESFNDVMKTLIILLSSLFGGITLGIFIGAVYVGFQWAI